MQLSASSDRTVKVWDLESVGNRNVQPLRTIFGYSGVEAVETINKKIITGHSDGSLRIWAEDCNNTIKEISNYHFKKIISIKTFHYLILTLSRDSTIKVLDTRNFKLLYNLWDPNFFVSSDYTDFDVSPSCCEFVACGSKNGIFMWDINNLNSIENNSKVPIERRRKQEFDVPFYLSHPNNALPILQVKWQENNSNELSLLSTSKTSSILFWKHNERHRIF